eukprot:jgi/Botrbrau1/9060/Bobra.0376s0034.2
MLLEDIILNLPEHGIHLRFDSRSQRLRLIEGYDLTRAEVHYNAKLIGGAQHPATFVRVYETCGRTYPGEFDEQTNTYLLHYPGLLFMFPIPSQHAMFAENELPLEFPDGTTPVASRFAIHAAPLGTTEAVLSATPPPLPADDLYYEVVEARVGEGLYFTHGGQRILFGDTPQDILSELGCPTETLLKRVDSIAINAGLVKPQGKCPSGDYFYSYADRGIDVLFCGHRNVVKKFVLRTNVPGHPEFSMYQKCNFQLVVPHRSDKATNDPCDAGTVASMNLQQVQEDLGSDEQPIPVSNSNAPPEDSSGQKFGSWVNPLDSLIEGFTDWQFHPSSPKGCQSDEDEQATASEVAISQPVSEGKSSSAKHGETVSSASADCDTGVPCTDEQDERDGWDDWDVHLPNLGSVNVDSASEAASRRSEVPSTHYASMVPTFSTIKKSADGSPVASVTADSTWEAVKAVMGEAGRAAIHSQQRIHTFVYGYRGVAFEVLKNGYIASMTLFQP